MLDAELRDKSKTSPALDGTVTFLFTDIEGSTKLLESLGRQYADVLADQRQILRTAFAQWNGQEIDTQGDSFFVAFNRANSSLRCVIEVQRALSAHEWPQEAAVRVRMGLYTGEPLVTTEGYIGMDVHRAARIASAGHGGQVLISQSTRELIYQDLPEGVNLRDLGTHKLKDIRHPQQIYQLDIEGLPSEFPALKTLATADEPPTPGEAPYKGLQHFDEADAEWFFGRDDVATKLAEAISAGRFLAVVGASGSGKSSVVRAGLLPMLKRDASKQDASVRWKAQVMTPTAHPLEAVALNLTRGTESVTATATLMDDLASDHRSLYLFAQKVLTSSDEEDGPDRLLLVVDQFEELFTLCRSDAERRAFVDNLVYAVSEPDAPMAVLITLRADFYEHLASFARLCELVAKHQEYVLPMGLAELHQVIEGPAEKGGWEFSPGLVALILHDVGASEGRQPEPGALPLLSHALLETWRRRRGNVMTLKAYSESGGVRGAIAQSAERVYYRELDAGQRDIARRIFLRLTELGEGTQDTRRRATISELVPTDGDPEELETVLVKLADARLITTSEGSAEVAHEALIREWPTLREWLAEDREGLRLHRHLTEAAQEWELLGRDQGELYRGARLAQAQEWEQANPNELNELEKTFLDASVAETERTLAVRERRRRRTLFGLAAGLILAIGLSLFAFNQSNQAQESAFLAQQESHARATAQAEAEAEALARATAQTDAEEQRHAALVQASIGLSSQAALELEGSSPERAILLALEALENYPYTWQAERALGQAVFENHLRLTLVHDAWINTATWAPDQAQILTASDDETAKVWDAVTGELVFSFEHADWVISAIWSPSGDRILTHSGPAGGEVYVWDAATGTLIQSFNPEQGYALQVDWSPSGDQILTANQAVGNSKVWDAGTGDLLLTLAAPRVCKQGIGMCAQQNEAWSPSGDRILTYDDVGNFQIWDARSGEQLRHITAHDERINSLAWSPDGERIVTGSVDGTAKTWIAETGEELVSFEKHEDAVWMASWSPSGDRIVTSGDGDRTARVWDAATGEELVVFDQHNGLVFPAVWSPSGEHILSAGDGGARIWNASSGEEIQTFIGHDATIFFAEWSASGEQILTAGPDGTAKIWDVASEMETLEISAEAGAYDILDWSPDGTRIARNFDVEGYPVKVYDSFSGELLLSFPTDHDYEVWTISFSPSGDRLATSTAGDATVKIWDATDGELVTIFEGHEIEGDEERGLPNPRWSPDGTKIVSSGASAIRIWDAATGEEEMVFEDPQGADQFNGLVVNRWSPDGTRIASVSYAYAMIWNAVSGEIEHEFFPPDNRVSVSDVSWSPDGTRLAAHADDGFLRIWDTSSGEKLLEAPGHDSYSIELKWLPSGDRIISGDGSSTIKIFDTSTGAEVFATQVPGHELAFLSPDGSRFATLDPTEGPVKIFSIWNSLDELIDIARECCVFRQLTTVEREQFGLPPAESG